MCIYHVCVYYYKPSSIWNYIVLHVYVWVIVCVKEHMRVCVCICVWKLYVCICICVCVYMYMGEISRGVQSMNLMSYFLYV